ncbi:hypothetical protein [Paraburkholderia sp. UCT31]|uniref:hypothetical protein n=1 Tax=Paraburkholderia sp. UCT31 TaxID=2615209 RepID=UPI00223B9349|nr:hypothetical protein [Paraburkholderia sp. UCT31]
MESYLRPVMHGLDAPFAQPDVGAVNKTQVQKMVALHRFVGAILVPVMWSIPRSGAVLLLPDTGRVFVYVNLDATWKDVVRVLTDALPYCFVARGQSSADAGLAEASVSSLDAESAGLSTDMPVLDGPHCAEEFVKFAEDVFATPVYGAIRDWQIGEGGRNPAFIGDVLGVALGDAYELSQALWPTDLA